MKKILTMVILAIVSTPALADVNPPMPRPPERLPEALPAIVLLALGAYLTRRRRRQG